MKVKVSQIVVAVDVLKKLGGIDGLTAKQAYKVAKLLRKAQAAFEDYDKGRISSASKYGEKNGDNYEIPPDKVGAFNSELLELLNDEIELGCDVVEISDDIVGLNPHDFNALEPFVTVKE